MSINPDLVTAPSSALDAVCGVVVEAPEEHLSVTFAGARFFFCGDACRQDFKRDARGYAERRPEAAHRPPAPPAVNRESPFEILGPGQVDDGP